MLILYLMIIILLIFILVKLLSINNKDNKVIKYNIDKSDIVYQIIEYYQIQGINLSLDIIDTLESIKIKDLNEAIAITEILRNNWRYEYSKKIKK